MDDTIRHLVVMLRKVKNDNGFINTKYIAGLVDTMSSILTFFFLACHRSIKNTVLMVENNEMIVLSRVMSTQNNAVFSNNFTGHFNMGAYFILLSIQYCLDLRKPDLRKNLDLRKIVATTDFLVHKLFDLRKIF